MAPTEKVIQLLSTKYSPKIELHYTNNFELLIAVILSAQCTDKMVNKVTPLLFSEIQTETPETTHLLEKYSIKKTVETTEMAHVAGMKIGRLEKLIHSTGFYKAKSANIQKTAQKLLEIFHGAVPDSMDELLTLSGVARKTANVILSTAYGKNEGIVVDTHVKRITQRLRLINPSQLSGRERVTFIKGKKEMIDYIKDANAVLIEKKLMSSVDKHYWGTFPHLLVKLGRDVCKAHNPQCGQCIISSYCPVKR